MIYCFYMDFNPVQCSSIILDYKFKIFRTSRGFTTGPKSMFIVNDYKCTPDEIFSKFNFERTHNVRYCLKIVLIRASYTVLLENYSHAWWRSDEIPSRFNTNSTSPAGNFSSGPHVCDIRITYISGMQDFLHSLLETDVKSYISFECGKRTHVFFSPLNIQSPGSWRV